VDIMLKLAGALAGFYIFRGALGRAKDGDLTKLMLLFGLMALIFFVRPMFKV
jgi:hypothetical protein